MVYGCTVYLHFVTRSGKIKTGLVTSKSRVAPIKQKTISRLEQLGVLLLSHLINKLCEHFHGIYEITNIFAWIDSSIAFCWLTIKYKVYKTLDF